jgi:hypothetical protein
LYFNFFSASFCTTFPPVGVATSISVHVLSFFLNNNNNNNNMDLQQGTEGVD